MDRLGESVFGIVFAVVLGILVVIPKYNDLSPSDRLRFGKQLGHSLSGSTVVVFTSSKCSASNWMEKNLTRRGIAYVREDIDLDPRARAVHKALGENYFGTTGTLATPTVVVNGKVLRSCDIEMVESALKAI